MVRKAEHRRGSHFRDESKRHGPSYRQCSAIFLLLIRNLGFPPIRNGRQRTKGSGSLGQGPRPDRGVMPRPPTRIHRTIAPHHQHARSGASSRHASKTRTAPVSAAATSSAIYRTVNGKVPARQGGHMGTVRRRNDALRRFMGRFFALQKSLRDWNSVHNTQRCFRRIGRAVLGPQSLPCASRTAKFGCCPPDTLG